MLISVNQSADDYRLINSDFAKRKISPDFYDSCSPEKIRSLLTDTIQSVLDDHSDFHDPNCFVRNRKLPIEDLVGIIFSLNSSNMNIQLCRQFGYDPDKVPANSSFSEARGKLGSEIFKEIFEKFREQIQRLQPLSDTFKGCRICAIDGMTLPLETFNKEEEDLVNTRSETIYRAGVHVNALYNVLDRQFLDTSLQRISKKNEIAAAKELIKNNAGQNKTIFVLDRGYHNFALEAMASEVHTNFVIRMRERDFYSLLGRNCTDLKEIDEKVDRVLVPSLTRKWRNDGIHKMVQKSKFPQFCKTSEYPFSARLIKFEISEGHFEYLITNLPQEEFSIYDLKILYRSRWGIEVGFLDLKYSIGLMSVHARKMENIKQEIYSALTLFNAGFASICYCEARLEEQNALKKSTAKNKYEYQINKKFAIELLRDFFSFKILDEEPVVQQIIKKKSPVKPNRYFKRNVVRRNMSNQHRIS